MAVPPDPRDPAIAEWGRLVALPSRQIPLDEAALTIARCARPHLDIVGELARLDAIAGGCSRPTVDGVVKHLFDRIGLRGAAENYDDPDNSFIDQVLTRGVGIPISLAVVTIEVARRVGVPLFGVGLPGHFLVGVTGAFDTYIDVFAGGDILDRRGVQALMRRVTGGSAQWDDAWLEPVDNRALLVRMTNNLKASYSRRNDLTGLRWVLRLRARLSAGVADADRDEFRRLMARTN